MLKRPVTKNCKVSGASGGPARGDRTLWEATWIGDSVSIGSNATILPIRICSDVVIGAGSVVTRDIEERVSMPEIRHVS